MDTTVIIDFTGSCDRWRGGLRMGKAQNRAERSALPKIVGRGATRQGPDVMTAFGDQLLKRHLRTQQKQGLGRVRQDGLKHNDTKQLSQPRP